MFQVLFSRRVFCLAKFLLLKVLHESEKLFFFSDSLFGHKKILTPPRAQHLTFPAEITTIMHIFDLRNREQGRATHPIRPHRGAQQITGLKAINRLFLPSVRRAEHNQT
jgi:hypothetical protein